MKRAGAVLVAAVFLDMLGFGMLIPGVQLRLESFGAQGWLIGLVQSSTFMIQTLVSPLWGRFGDQVGRKTVFVTCTMLSALSMGIYAVAPSVLLIALSRVVAGFGGANVSAAQALVAGSAEDRTANLGRI
ncbi:MAG: MFS transporter, partial [Armatimonadota bacterium]